MIRKETIMTYFRRLSGPVYGSVVDKGIRDLSWARCICCIYSFLFLSNSTKRLVVISGLIEAQSCQIRIKVSILHCLRPPFPREFFFY